MHIINFVLRRACCRGVENQHYPLPTGQEEQRHSWVQGLAGVTQFRSRDRSFDFEMVNGCSVAQCVAEQLRCVALPLRRSAGYRIA